MVNDVSARSERRNRRHPYLVGYIHKKVRQGAEGYAAGTGSVESVVVISYKHKTEFQTLLPERVSGIVVRLNGFRERGEAPHFAKTPEAGKPCNARTAA